MHWLLSAAHPLDLCEWKQLDIYTCGIPLSAAVVNWNNAHETSKTGFTWSWMKKQQKDWTIQHACQTWHCSELIMMCDIQTQSSVPTCMPNMTLVFKANFSPICDMHWLLSAAHPLDLCECWMKKQQKDWTIQHACQTWHCSELIMMCDIQTQSSVPTCMPNMTLVFKTKFSPQLWHALTPIRCPSAGPVRVEAAGPRRAGSHWVLQLSIEIMYMSVETQIRVSFCKWVDSISLWCFTVQASKHFFVQVEAARHRCVGSHCHAALFQCQWVEQYAVQYPLLERRGTISATPCGRTLDMPHADELRGHKEWLSPSWMRTNANISCFPMAKGITGQHSRCPRSWSPWHQQWPCSWRFCSGGSAGAGSGSFEPHHAWGGDLQVRPSATFRFGEVGVRFPFPSPSEALRSCKEFGCHTIELEGGWWYGKGETSASWTFDLTSLDDEFLQKVITEILLRMLVIQQEWPPHIDQVRPDKKKRAFWFASFILSSLVSMCHERWNKKWHYTFTNQSVLLQGNSWQYQPLVSQGSSEQTLLSARHRRAGSHWVLQWWQNSSLWYTWFSVDVTSNLCTSAVFAFSIQVKPLRVP